MSWRTSLAGIPAGLAFLLSALSSPGPWTWPRAMLALGGALLAVLATFAGDHRREVPASLPHESEAIREALARILERDAARTVDPPEPDKAPVGPSLDIFARVARREMTPEEGARALEIGRERRPVDVVSFEDAVKATREQPKGEP